MPLIMDEVAVSVGVKPWTFLCQRTERHNVCALTQSQDWRKFARFTPTRAVLLEVDQVAVSFGLAHSARRDIRALWA